MPLLDKIVPVGPEQPIDFYITKNKTLFNGKELLPAEKLFDNSRDKIDQSLKEKLIFVDRFASMIQ